MQLEQRSDIRRPRKCRSACSARFSTATLAPVESFFGLLLQLERDAGILTLTAMDGMPWKLQATLGRNSIQAVNGCSLEMAGHSISQSQSPDDDDDDDDEKSV